MNPDVAHDGFPTGLPPLRILCVDDNRDVADSAGLLLRVVGFEVRSCYSGPEALRIVSDFRPAVCLIDLNMPGMEGDELAVRLRELSPEMPMILIAVTAMSDEDSRRRIAAAGFDLHLVKPVDPFHLLRVIDSLKKFWSTIRPT